MTIDLSTGNGRHGLAVRGNDLYETPLEATKTLLGVEPLPKGIWEPCCGPGAIARVLRAAGHTVVACDLVNYGTADQDYAGWDFLMETRRPIGTDAIVTNPPFKNADAFVRNALQVAPKVAMLLRLGFLESQRRQALFQQGGLARVHVFSRRLPMMHRDGWKGPTIVNSSVGFAWFVWERGHAGAASLNWVDWKDYE